MADPIRVDEVHAYAGPDGAIRLSLDGTWYELPPGSHLTYEAMARWDGGFCRDETHDHVILPETVIGA